MSFWDGTTAYEDYKYVMADTSCLYLGAKYSWEDIIRNEEIPFKVRTIVQRYILPETMAENTLESEIYYVKNDGILYKTLRQLKVKVKYLQKGKKSRFEQTYMSLEDFARIPASEKEKRQIMIQEISISKLALMMFAV